MSSSAGNSGALGVGGVGVANVSRHRGSLLSKLGGGGGVALNSVKSSVGIKMGSEVGGTGGLGT